MPAQIDFPQPIDISKLKTAEDIKKVQQFLLDQSDESVKYNLGPSGVDGKLGKKDSYTRKAIEQYNTWLAGENAKRAAEAQSQAQAEQERLAKEAEQKAQENVAQVVASTDPAKQVTTPVQTPTATTAVSAPKTTVVLPSSIDTKKVVEELYPKKDKAATSAPADADDSKKTYYDVVERPAVVTSTQNKTLKPIDMLNLGQMEMHKDRVNAIKGIGKTGEEDTTETTTTTENPTATQTFDQAMADRSYLQSLFDDRRKAAEKERTDQLALASYNSLGNALRSLAQPLGWWAGGSTANVQPYDRRAYLDAFNRAVAASNDLRNINDKEAEYYLNRAEWDRRQAQTLDDYEKKKEIEKQTQLAIIQARSDAAIKTLKEKVAQGGGKNIYADRLTSAVQGWIIHGGETPLMDYLDSIERATPGYFGKERPSAKVVREIEKAANDAGEATTQTGAQSAVTSTQGTSTQKNKAVAQSGLTADEQAIINKWKSVDTNNDGRIDSNERKVAKSNGLASPSKKEARRYEKASTKKAGLTTSNGATSARSIMGQNK